MDISRQDWQLLSEYIDDELSDQQKARLEARLDEEQDLRGAYRKLQWTRDILRSTPRITAPRNFILTPQMVGQHQPQTLFPVFRMATVLVSFLLVAVLIFDFGVTNLPLGAMAPAAPAPRQEAVETSGDFAEGAARQPDAEEPQLESLAEQAPEEEKAAGDVEEEREEGAEISEAPQPTQTLPGTSTSPPPTETPAPPQPLPGESIRRLPPLRMLEGALAVLVLVFGAGMLLTRKGRSDAG